MSRNAWTAVILVSCWLVPLPLLMGSISLQRKWASRFVGISAYDCAE